MNQRDHISNKFSCLSMGKEIRINERSVMKDWGKRSS
jgi:hypothetical protein